MKLHMYDGGVRTQHILAPTMGLKVREITLDLDDFEALLGQPDPLLVLITRFGPKEENTMSELKQYRCIKFVRARPMTRGEYNDYRGWQIPADEDPSDPGYLVVYNKDTVDHYESWSPKHIFDAGYVEVPK